MAGAPGVHDQLGPSGCSLMSVRFELAEVLLDESSRGSLVHAHVGDQVVVKLRETPTSGYRWMPNPPQDDVLTLDRSEFASEPGSTLGGSGHRVLAFTASRAGQSSIRLALRRSWEREQGSAVDHYQVEVAVT